MELFSGSQKHNDLEELRPIKELQRWSYAIWNPETYYGYLLDSLFIKHRSLSTNHDSHSPDLTLPCPSLHLPSLPPPAMWGKGGAR